jgi:hypothetical protein
VAATTGGIAIGRNASCTAQYAIAIGDSVVANVASGFFTLSGLATASGTTLVYNNTTGQIGPTASTQRYKTNIRPTSLDTSKVLQLQPVDFNWNDHENVKHLNGASGFGMIAEDVDAILPEIVIKDDKGVCQSINYDKVGVLLIPEVRRIVEQNQMLEKENALLRAQLDKIEAALGLQ